MNDIQVNVKEEQNKGMAYVANEKGEVLAEMTYSRANNDLLIIDHTGVQDVLRGMGVGRKMLDALVEMARKEGSKILPLCPYAKSVFDKDDSIADVLR